MIQIPAGKGKENHKYKTNKIIEYEILCKIELIAILWFRFQAVLVLPGSASNRFLISSSVSAFPV